MAERKYPKKRGAARALVALLHSSPAPCSRSLRFGSRPHEMWAVLGMKLALEAGEVVLPLADGASELLSPTLLLFSGAAEPGDHAGYLR